MTEILFNGTAGRLHGHIHRGTDTSPIALVLPPHPNHGETMDNKVVFALYKMFAEIGFTTLRINYRGVGKSTGLSSPNDGELNDAAMAMDWLQNQYPTVRNFWVTGFSFGSWIGMQLLMRRPEIEAFIAVAPPAHLYDFSFLTPCPVPGLIAQGIEDEVVPISSVNNLLSKMRIHKNVQVEYAKIEGANHCFDNHKEQIIKVTRLYTLRRMQKHAKRVAC